MPVFIDQPLVLKIEGEAPAMSSILSASTVSMEYGFNPVDGLIWLLMVRHPGRK